MRYYVDFDRTVFNTPAFKEEFSHTPTPTELWQQVVDVFKEIFSPDRKLTLRRIVARTLGTYASHRRIGFSRHELKEYLYPDAVEFFKQHGEVCTIVTYGVRAFITAKVANALTSFTLKDIVYTHSKKGKTIQRLTKGEPAPYVFVDDAVFQLESVSKVNPNVICVEIRRDGGEGDGRWPVIQTFQELPAVIAAQTPIV